MTLTERDGFRICQSLAVKELPLHIGAARGLVSKTLGLDFLHPRLKPRQGYIVQILGVHSTCLGLRCTISCRSNLSICARVGLPIGSGYQLVQSSCLSRGSLSKLPLLLLQRSLGALSIPAGCLCA